MFESKPSSRQVEIGSKIGLIKTDTFHCIVVCNVMGFPDYRIWKATNPNGKSSSATLLDISISTSPNFAQTKVSSISL
jgi:hypothetical protein